MNLEENKGCLTLIMFKNNNLWNLFLKFYLFQIWTILDHELDISVFLQHIWTFLEVFIVVENLDLLFCTLIYLIAFTVYFSSFSFQNTDLNFMRNQDQFEDLECGAAGLDFSLF